MMLRKLALGLGLVAALPGGARAQYYFGQNKVQYRTFDFQVLKTEHFDIYFYPEAREATLDAGRMAERSYAILSRILRHQYRERKPIILYASHSDFQQTNALGGESPSEGTGGVTDFFKQRIILPFTGSYDELQHVLQHEMVHQFQYDIWSRGRAGAGLQTLIAVNPPLWFVEGMAEYLSIGGIDPNTAMWLRDAAIEGKIPTIEQLENDPRIFPYRFGQALVAFIAERWGDEAISAILHGTLVGGGGLEGALRRVIGVDYRQLSEQWKDAVQRRYLPEIGTRQKARDVAEAVLTERRSKGRYHLAPALSPDGSEVAYFSERDFYFIDLYLADARTGAVKRRLLKSSYSSNYETYRFINSQASWSPDGKYLAIAAKRGPRDDIVIIDVARNREHRRIQVKLNGVTTPSWSPDGRRLVFTGYDGGLSDLFLVNADGSDLRRLTRDKYADLQPVWSPDGTRIAFATDRGPGTELDRLRIGNLKLALYDLASGRIEVLPHMEAGKNVSPQWSPDGQEIAFVSDRNGVSNIFLFDLRDQQVYQLTDLYTGAQGITPYSPVLSWARSADRLAFVYYARGDFDVYAVTNPRALKRQPSPALAGLPRDSAFGPIGRVEDRPRDSAFAPLGRVADTAAAPLVQSGSIYVSDGGFRQADSTPTLPADSARRPVSITALLDSAALPLPDTTEFSIRPYKVDFKPDYVARPSIGYVRDNFGGGIYGGSAIVLSDILGNHNLIFAGFVNGRLSEASVTATYVNLNRRLNWAAGLSQEPFYFFEPSLIETDPNNPNQNLFHSRLRRIVVRSADFAGLYPFSRFLRTELGFSAATVTDHRQTVTIPYDPLTGEQTDDASVREVALDGYSYVAPSAALVWDNSLPGYVGPFYGRRWRLEASQTLGGRTFTTLLADYRRYDKVVGPFTFATRALFYGRLGRDAQQFGYQIFLGSTDLLRGNTSGSYYRNECRLSVSGTITGCTQLDELLGTRIAVASAELRFPILTPQFHFIPLGFPPIEGALFYDVGVAWNEGNTVRFRRDAGDDPLQVRVPHQTLGVSFRMNFFNFVILRLDYSVPQERRAIGGYWTLSLGPVF
ncbi:MAG TPA: DPP IV N-terminal domain-containing protein [Gemmatimonadales bacterium]|jgi:Tol biopolymer transport system component|nr:DPP IV N-terminal domain-containing protein [Gemmatimonadales bacterium]